MAARPALPQELDAQFAALENRIRRIALMRGWGRTALIVTLVVGTALLADWLLDLSAGLRLGLLVTASVAVAAAAWVGVVRPLWRRMTLPELAAVVEEAHPNLKGRLLSMAELNDPNVPESEKGSELMRRLLARQTLRSVAQVQFADAVPPGRSRRWAVVGLVALVLLLSPWMFGATTYNQLWARLLNPFGGQRNPRALTFRIEGGDQAVPQGEDVALRAIPKGEFDADAPPPVRLVWREDDGATDDRLMDYDRESRSWTLERPRVKRSFTLHVDSDGKASPSYRVEVIARPEIAAATLDVTPPGYTGLPASTVDGVVGDIPVFERSQLRLRLTFTQPVRAAALRWLAVPPSPHPDAVIDDAAEPEKPEEPKEPEELPGPIALQVDKDGLAASATFPATHGGAFAFELTNTHGLHNVDEPYRNLVFVPDLPPRLRLTEEPRSEAIRPDDVLPIGAEAADDVGVAALELHVETSTGKTDIASVPDTRLPSGLLAHAFRIDVAALELETGDTLTYRVRAADGRPQPGPQETWSDPRTLTVRAGAESSRREQVAERQRQWRESLDAIREDLEQTREEVADVHQDAEADRKAQRDFERDADIPPLADRERELAERLEQFAGRLADHPLFEQVAEVAREAARQSLEPAAQELRQATEQPLPEKADALNKNLGRLAEAQRQLEDAAQRFEAAAALERDLQEVPELAREAERLAERAQDLAERQNEQPAEQNPADQNPTEPQREAELAAEQEALAQDQQALNERLEDLFERQPEIIEAARQEELDRLRELAAEAARLAAQQERLAEALRRDAEQATQDDQPADDQPADDQPADNQPMDGQQESGRALTQTQRELANEAARLALEAVRQRGAQSESARQAIELARQAEQAARAAETGLLERAGETAEQAAQSASEAAQQLGQAEGGAPANAELQQQAERLAEAQRRQQQALGEAAESPAARRAVRQAGQQALAESTEDLAQRFAESARHLASDPLNLSQPGQQAGQAAQAAEDAQQAMQQAAGDIGQANADSAATAAKQAAEALRRAAGQAAGQPQQPQSPVPGEVGRQVAEAKRQLDDAGEQLAQNGPMSPMNGEGTQPTPGQSNQNGNSQPSQNQPAQNGPSSASQASQNLRQASQALNQAAQSSQPGQGGQGQPSSQQASQMPGEQGQSPPSERGDGSGAKVTIGLVELENELQRQARREWGQLPGHLRTEILQGSQHRTQGDYARLIRLYSEEILKAQEGSRQAP